MNQKFRFSWLLVFGLIFTAGVTSLPQLAQGASSEPTAQASTIPQLCLNGFQAYLQTKSAIGVPQKHLPRFYFAEQARANYIIIFIHGIFESPYFFKAINMSFAANHFNSMSILLPGHWQENLTALDDVTKDDWTKELEDAIQLAHCFAPHVILAGHSLGGLLSVNKILKSPDQISGLILLSPSLKMNWLAAAGAKLGTYLGLNGSIFLGTKPDHDEVSYISARAADQIYELIDSIALTYSQDFDFDRSAKNNDYSLSQYPIYSRIHAPVFVAYAENDPAVSNPEIDQFLQQVQGPHTSHFFVKSTGVWHGNIGKAPIDTYARSPKDYNPEFEIMTQEMNEFLNSNFK
jgi:pimeloyl-ACP methyl ester carboxylesterase